MKTMKKGFTVGRQERMLTDYHNPCDWMALPHVNLEPVLGSPVIYSRVPEATDYVIKDLVCSTTRVNNYNG